MKVRSVVLVLGAVPLVLAAVAGETAASSPSSTTFTEVVDGSQVESTMLRGSLGRPRPRIR